MTKIIATSDRRTLFFKSMQDAMRYFNVTQKEIISAIKNDTTIADIANDELFYFDEA